MATNIEFLKRLIEVIDTAIKGFLRIKKDMQAVVDKTREYGD
jgi:hypothetical protein